MTPFSSDPLERLKQIVARLRAPDGCPWDREQTHASLRTSLIEETYETVAAIDAGDDANLCEELGDLLLHVTLHSQMAAERGAFDLAAVAEGVCEKMIRRHPHVFGDAEKGDSAAILAQWDEIKRREKGAAPTASLMDGLLSNAPSLLRAQKAQQKAARGGFDWREMGEVIAKLREEIDEVEEAMAQRDPAAVADELGDVLFSLVNVARWQDLEAELLLARATDKFVRRFRGVEDVLREQGRAVKSLSLEELDAVWEQVKASQRMNAGNPPAVQSI